MISFYRGVYNKFPNNDKLLIITFTVLWRHTSIFLVLQTHKAPHSSILSPLHPPHPPPMPSRTKSNKLRPLRPTIETTPPTAPTWEPIPKTHSDTSPPSNEEELEEIDQLLPDTKEPSPPPSGYGPVSNPIPIPINSGNHATRASTSNVDINTTPSGSTVQLPSFAEAFKFSLSGPGTESLLVSSTTGSSSTWNPPPIRSSALNPSMLGNVAVASSSSKDPLPIPESTRGSRYIPLPAGPSTLNPSPPHDHQQPQHDRSRISTIHNLLSQPEPAPAPRPSPSQSHFNEEQEQLDLQNTDIVIDDATQHQPNLPISPKLTTSLSPQLPHSPHSHDHISSISNNPTTTTTATTTEDNNNNPLIELNKPTLQKIRWQLFLKISKVSPPSFSLISHHNQPNFEHSSGKTSYPKPEENAALSSTHY